MSKFESRFLSVVGGPIVAACFPLLVSGACEGGDDARGGSLVEVPAPKSVDEAVGRLGVKEQLAFATWQKSLFKECSVQAAFASSGPSADGTRSVDLELLEKQLVGKRLLQESGGARFALLDPGAPSQNGFSRSESSHTSSVTVNGKTELHELGLSLAQDADECVVRIDTFEVQRVKLREHVSVVAYFDREQKIEREGIYDTSSNLLMMSRYKQVTPVPFTDAITSALSPSAMPASWAAKQLGADESDIRKVFAATPGTPSFRLVAGDVHSPDFANEAAITDHVPWFATPSAEAFVTAEHVDVEAHYLLWAESRALSATLHVGVKSVEPAQAQNAGYWMRVAVTDGSADAPALESAKQSAACVLGVFETMLAANPREADTSAGEAAALLDGADFFAACNGYSSDPYSAVLDDAKAREALADWLSNERVDSAAARFDWRTAFESFLVRAMAEPAVAMRLTALGTTSHVLGDLGRYADDARGELAQAKHAELIRPRLATVIVGRMENALFLKQPAQLDAARMVRTADGIAELHQPALDNYFDSLDDALVDDRSVQNVEACIARVGEPERTAIHAVDAQLVRMADLGEFVIENKLDVITPWLFMDGPCPLSALQNEESVLKSGADFFAAEKTRGFDALGASDMGELLGNTVAAGFQKRDYDELTNVAVMFRQKPFCDQPSVASSTMCAASGDLATVLTMVDARYKSRYGKLASHLVSLLQKLDDRFDYTADLETHFTDPLWGRCDAAAFARKQAALDAAVKRVISAQSFSDVGAAREAFDAALADC